MFKRILLALAAIGLLSSCNQPIDEASLGVSNANWEDVAVCAASDTAEPVPDFSGPTCQNQNLHEVDPQNRLIWIRAIVSLPQTKGPNGEPLILYVSGKMSSRVYLNGTLVGRNCTPGKDAKSEITGQMDTTLYPPQDLFKVGGNEVVLLASSHRGILSLAHPVHAIGIAPAGLFAEQVLVNSASVLITFGVFLLGGIYFGVMALISARRFQFAILSAVSLSAGGQLMSESLRGLTSYPYPIHDVRLIAITVFSGTFGLGMALYVLRAFSIRHLGLAMAALSIVTAIAVLAFDGFDYKALGAMTVPLLACLVATGIWARQHRPRAFEHFLATLAFVAAILMFHTQFLDTVFFLLVAFFLLLLFVDQARSSAQEARQRRSEEARANRLEQALAQAEESAEPGHIDVKGAGQIERITTSDIVHCQGAGGYCELKLTNGRTLLHAVSLNEMEETLPATFLRIHRSHLVNVQFIQSLVRGSSGTGSLSLRDGTDLPVSRRVMPKVRRALN